MTKELDYPIDNRLSRGSAYIDTEGLTGKEAEALQDLAKIDWTFAEANTREHTHSLHPYPAKFIPQIPRKLIHALHPKDGSATLDPFCGSGTTLLESILQGIPAIGVDANPLAVLISRVKTTQLESYFDEVVSCITTRTYSRLKHNSSISIPDIPHLDHWFKPEISRVVAIIAQEITEAKVDTSLRDALNVALSCILVRVSNQESDVRYAAIDKAVTPERVIDAFKKNALDVSRKLARTFDVPSFPNFRSAEATVIHADTRKLHNNLPSWRIGLIVTSPPYPNAYEYWLYHKYRMYWLGMDPITAKKSEIGARPYYSQKNGLTAEDFAHDMKQCFQAFSGLLPSKRYACLLMGNSRIRGTYVDNAKLLTCVAEEHSFRLRASFPRQIPSKRKSFNPVLGSIRHEALLIFQRK